MFEELLNDKNEWFNQSGPLEEVVVSGRVRFARNLDGEKFPHHANAAEQRQIVENIQKAVTTVLV